MFKTYDSTNFFDEMIENNVPKRHYAPFYEQLLALTNEQLLTKHNAAQSSFLRQGITFTVYGAEGGTERTMPFDFIPIIIPHDQWLVIEQGMKQRIKALNMFLHDVYNERRIIHEGVIPATLVDENPYYSRQVIGANIALQNHVFMAGIDLIRDEHGTYRVLEDNLRNPSGLSYVFQNRYVMRKIYPEFFKNYAIETLEDQMGKLQEALLAHRPPNLPHYEQPTAVLLSAGVYNSAYYDHVFLAKEMNIRLVEGRDLLVKDDKVYVKTIRGLKRVDIIYRRIDDDFLDPTVFREDSLLGVAGVLQAYKKGNVSILNAVGNGVADDKAMYVYVPDMIRYYLNEEPLIENVKTYLLTNADDLDYVLQNLETLVVKNVGESGGYDMLIGPHASEELRQKFREKILAAPHSYIAQPTIKLSRAPAFQQGKFYPCHIDLRIFVIQGRTTHIVPGGLSRVALQEGSLVVNSSQGGGGKDTWVLKEENPHA